MEDKKLKKMRRSELLEVLRQEICGRETLEARLATLEEKLRAAEEKLAATEAKLALRETGIRESGSLAEAALRLSDVFRAADEAADLYVSERKKQADEDAAKAVADAWDQAVQILDEANAKRDSILAGLEKDGQAAGLEQDVQNRWSEYVEAVGEETDN